MIVREGLRAPHGRFHVYFAERTHDDILCGVATSSLMMAKGNESHRRETKKPKQPKKK